MGSYSYRLDLLDVVVVEPLVVVVVGLLVIVVVVGLA